MKKIILMLVISGLILVSCTDATVKETDEGENEVFNNDYSDSSPYVFMIDGELPDIGKFSGNSHDSYFDEPVYDFVPGDYGKMIPYLGAVKDFGDMKRYSYGLCDENGKIIMNASRKTRGIVYNDDGEGRSVFSITVKDEDTEDTEAIYDDYYYSKVSVAGGNGKWIKNLDGGWCNFICDGIVSVTKNDFENDKLTCVLYNYDGEEIMTVDGYDNVNGYGCGLLCVTNWNEDGTEFYFLNLEGEIVLGPYIEASSFNEYGITYVTDNNYNTYLIDTTGKAITEKNYTGCFVQGGYKGGQSAFVMTENDDDGGFDIFRNDGTYAGSVNDENVNYISLRFPDNGDIIYSYTIYNEDYSHSTDFWKRLSDGADFVCVENGMMPSSYIGNDNTYVCVDENSNGYVINGDGETIAVIEDYHEDGFEISDDGRYIAYNSGKYVYDYNADDGENSVNDTRKFTIYDTVEKKVLYKADKAGFASFVGDGRYIKFALYSDVGFYSVDEEYFLFDTQKNKLIFENCLIIMSDKYHGEWYYNVCTKNSCTLYDSNLNVILKTYNE